MKSSQLYLVLLVCLGATVCAWAAVDAHVLPQWVFTFTLGCALCASMCCTNSALTERNEAYHEVRELRERNATLLSQNILFAARIAIGSPVPSPDVCAAMAALGMDNVTFSRADVIRAHRMRITTVHTDVGGSDAEARRVNTARDTLLRHLNYREQKRAHANG